MSLPPKGGLAVYGTSTQPRHQPDCAGLVVTHPDYRFIPSSSSTEGHLFKWSLTLVNALAKEHTSPHCHGCFGVANEAVNIVIMTLMPQLYELKKK